MGQKEVICFLKKCDEPKTRRQIAEGIKEDPIKVSKGLKKLVKLNEVSYIEYDKDEAQRRVDYMLSRRTRFFYLKE